MLVSSLDDSDSMPGGELSTTAGLHGGQRIQHVTISPASTCVTQRRRRVPSVRIQLRHDHGAGWPETA